MKPTSTYIFKRSEETILKKKIKKPAKNQESFGCFFLHRFSGASVQLLFFFSRLFA